MMRKHLFVVGLFVIVIIVMTFPLVFKLNTYLPGFFSTDESYEPVWYSWWMKFCLTNHLPINPVSCLAYPFGNSYNFFGYLFFLINLLLVLLTKPIITYNFQVLGNLFLTAFLLTYYCMLLQKQILRILFGFNSWVLSLYICAFLAASGGNLFVDDADGSLAFIRLKGGENNFKEKYYLLLVYFLRV